VRHFSPGRVKARLRPSQKRLGLGVRVGKTAANRSFQGTLMVNFPDSEGSHDPNFPVHVRNYLSFMNFLKWSVILTAIITAVVLYVISN
jgi:hypothetical protein